ncbi:hypothetical protein [Bdellovibrio sp. HCB337]|uniref:hypothetical protein n=1 Tax=Bdellovibrio sp. HCB337 TaxID=3394358 RepID=UPI0039A5E7EB
MKYSLGTVLILSLTGIQQAAACGYQIGAIQPGNKTVSIELNEPGVGKRWAIEDDGMLVMSIALAHCNQKLPDETVPVEGTVDECIYSTQSRARISMDAMVSQHSSLATMEARKRSVDLVKTACGVDLYTLKKTIEERVNKEPLACRKDVSGLVKKAAIRSKEFLAEQNDPTYLSGLNLSEAQKQELLERLKRDDELVQKMAQMFAQTSATNGEFKPLMMQFKSIVQSRAYSLAEHPEEPPSSHNLEGLDGILMSMGARLPYVPQSRCSFPLADSVIAGLKDIEWKPRTMGRVPEAPRQEGSR